MCRVNVYLQVHLLCCLMKVNNNGTVWISCKTKFQSGSYSRWNLEKLFKKFVIGGIILQDIQSVQIYYILLQWFSIMNCFKKDA